jgi:dihydroxyacetone kinase-like protein
MCNIATSNLLREIICDFAVTMQANATYLTELDEVIGDGDHGRNMAIGFQRIWEQVQKMPPTTPDLLLRTAGMTLVTTVSGASGPLYGAAFIAAGMEAHAHANLNLVDLARMTRAASEALARRGRCRLGDKTILDALQPAAKALTEAAARKDNLSVGLELAATAAKQGMQATVPLIARRGLAMQYGTASINHQDPGATSCYLLFDSILRTFRRCCS